MPVAATRADFSNPALTEPLGGVKQPTALARVLREHWPEFTAGLVFLLIGLALRLAPVFGAPDRLTLDEYLYITNVQMLKSVGPLDYSTLVQQYVSSQVKIGMVLLPPTRCIFIMLGWMWDALFHCGPRMALRCVASVFSCFTLLLGGVFAYRLSGVRMAVVTTGLMAVAPLELMMAHRELADGVFGFWAMLSLWLLWENMQKPGRLGWLAAYAGSISFMVLTKENAFFAAVALGGIQCVAAAWPGLGLGKASWSTMIATFAGGLMGLLVLVSITGSPLALVLTYKLLVIRAEKMTFAYATGGGPWFRYVVDLLLISPAVLLLAIGGIFQIRRDEKRALFLLLFVVISCAVMVNVKNGMNVRYATMWDVPLRFLAAGAIVRATAGLKRWPLAGAVAIVVLVGGIELHQYYLLFVRHDIGEPVTQMLMYANDIVRVPGQ